MKFQPGHRNRGENTGGVGEIGDFRPVESIYFTARQPTVGVRQLSLLFTIRVQNYADRSYRC